MDTVVRDIHPTKKNPGGHTNPIFKSPETQCLVLRLKLSASDPKLFVSLLVPLAKVQELRKRGGRELEHLICESRLSEILVGIDKGIARRVCRGSWLGILICRGRLENNTSGILDVTCSTYGFQASSALNCLISYASRQI